MTISKQTEIYYDYCKEKLCNEKRQSDRDIPVKPKKGKEKIWGKITTVPICPKCDYYLGQVYFLTGSKKITYCEVCGQAIDWSEWKND